MAKIRCPSVECEWNKNNRCTAKEIYLSEHCVHTVHQGFVRMWVCKGYQESERAKAIRVEMEKYMSGVMKK